MKVLMPIDGSDICNYTIEWACRFLSRDTNQIDLLMVIADPSTAEYQLEDALETLKTARAQLEACGLKVEKAEYMLGDPVQRICEYAEDENVDQILMGSHGRSGLQKMLLGSVSEGVLEHCHRPVFIYRHHLGQLAATRK